jgi:hypothetical protein
MNVMAAKIAIGEKSFPDYAVTYMCPRGAVLRSLCMNGYELRNRAPRRSAGRETSKWVKLAAEMPRARHGRRSCFSAAMRAGLWQIA